MKNLLFSISVFFSISCFSQVGINNTTPSAQLDIKSSNQATPANNDGLLIPRIDTFPATSPTIAQNGMMVYLTTTIGLNTPGFYYWNHPVSTWTSLASGSSSAFWKFDGNSVGSIKSIGTNDGYDLPIKTNGTEKMRITTTGDVGIGNSNPTTKLDITGSTNVSTGYYYGGINSPMNLEITRSLPVDAFTNNAVEIGNFSIVNGAHNFRISVTSSLVNQSQSKSYNVVTRNDQTVNTWQRLVPTSSTGTVNGHDFDIDINVSGQQVFLRFRKSAIGATNASGNVQIRIENTGSLTDVFTQTSLLSTVVAPTTSFLNNSDFAAPWIVGGNNITGNEFIGTTNSKDLIFKRNNLEAGRIGTSNTSYGEETFKSPTPSTTPPSFINNTAIGSYALNGITSGDGNTAVGRSALRTLTSEDYNTAVGGGSMYQGKGNFNSAYGAFSLYNCNGEDNVGIGRNSLFALGSTNIPSNYNTGLGFQTGGNQISGNYNLFVGYSAGSSQTSGNNNILIGSNTNVSNITGSDQMNIANTIYASSIGTATSKIGIGITSPQTKLEINGALSLKNNNVIDNININLTIGDRTYIKVNNAGATIAFTNGLSLGQLLILQNSGAGTFAIPNLLTINVPNPSVNLNAGGMAQFIWDGAAWQMISISNN
jgi:trimeric autotransporter adhesin